MKKEHTDFYNQVVNNVRKIMLDKNITQVAMGEYLGASESSMSKILSGQSSLTLDHLANLASNLSISVNDILYYGQEKKPDDPVEAVLQIRLMREKKNQILRLIFGEHNLEILNK